MRWVAAAVFVCGVMAAAPACAQEAEVSAVCVDARGVPHPAAQTFGGVETPAAFEGELFRCLAGTRLRYEVDRAVQDCGVGEALWFGAGALSCRAAVAQTREYDRDLLRQYGAGAKRLQLAAAPTPERRGPSRYPYGRRTN
jgi:hypothetical protein